MLIGYSLWVQIFLSEVSRTGQHVPCSSHPRCRLLLAQTRAEQSCCCAGHPRSRPPPVLSAGASPTSSSTSTAQQQARPCSTLTGIGHLRAARAAAPPPTSSSFLRPFPAGFEALASTHTPSSTHPIRRPSISLPEQTSPRAPVEATTAAHGRPSSTPFPVLRVT